MAAGAVAGESKMDNPIFRLEGIVRTKDETSDFEGPLTLILQLLNKNKIEIRDISISLILDQYLGYLETMAELDLDIASEFVTMASHLTYIKTKMLLSGEDEVSELALLISSLEELQRSDIYLQIKSVAQTLSQLYAREGYMMPGPPEYLPVDSEYKYQHSEGDLINAIMQVIGRENAVIGSMNPNKPVYPQRTVFSIPEKIVAILQRLKQSGRILVSVLLYESGSRPELIASFIAILELCRVGSIVFSGVEDDVVLTYTGAGRSEEAIAEAIEMSELW